MPRASPFSHCTDKGASASASQNSAHQELCEPLGKFRTWEVEPIPVSDTAADNGPSVLQKMQQLSFRGHRLWKPPQEEPPRERTTHFAPERSAPSRKQVIRATRDGSLGSGRLRTGIIEDLKRWFRTGAEQPLSSRVPSDATPTSTTSSLSPYQPLPLPVDGSGAAARHSAAARNTVLLKSQACKISPEHLPSDQKIDPRTLILGQSLTQNVESGVNLDPFICLPPELTAKVLSYLDTTSLARAEQVSRAWFRDARQSYAWGNVFRNETQRQRQNSMARTNQHSIQGAGLGNSSPNQKFKLMLRARRDLQERWKAGKATAIYLEGHTDSVYCVQFDEEKIVTGSRDRTIRIWDSRNYRCLKMLGAATRRSGNARLPIQTHGEGQIGRPLKIIIPPQEDICSSSATDDLLHTGSILCLQYDDRILVSGSSDSTCIIWEIRNQYQPVRRLQSHVAGVLDVCFDEKHIVSCSKDTTMCLWNRHTGERLRQMTGHRGPVNAVQMRGDLIVSASGDGIARLWNSASGHCIKEFPSRDRGMACVDFSLDSRMVLAGGNDQVIYQFDTSTGKMVRQMAGHEGLVRSLHLDNVNGRVVSGSYDNSVRAYDFATGVLITAFLQWTTSWILSAKSDYRRIVAASQDSRTVIMDFGHGVPNIDLLAA